VAACEGIELGGLSRFSARVRVKRRIRTTNRIERLNGEGRRRTKVIPRFPSERSCLSLLYASLIAAARHWRGIPMTVTILRQLQSLRAAIAAPTKEAEAVA
jgi:transposase-like protein